MRLNTTLAGMTARERAAPSIGTEACRRGAMATGSTARLGAGARGQACGPAGPD